jgi:hypothetical protein
MRSLKIWNGRGVDRNTHLYVAAYSRADAARILTETFRRGASEFISRLEIGRWQRELSVYFAEGCWGNSMDDITPERGVWQTTGYGRENRVRLYPVAKAEGGAR